MHCYNHPTSVAVGTCVNCGKAICTECVVDVANKILCRNCVSLGIRTPTPGSPGIPTNTLAIVSVILSVLGLLGCVCGGCAGGFLFGIPAAIIGWSAKSQIEKSPDQFQGRELALVGFGLGMTEITLSVLFACVVVVLYGGGFIAAILGSASSYR